MTAKERSELHRVIRISFEKGINKITLFEEMEAFIDRTYIYKHGTISELLKDINRHKSYNDWKRKLKREIADSIETK